MKSFRQLLELSYSAKKAAAGEDIGKPGKNFDKIAKKAAKEYGSEEAGKRVAGAILAKLRKESLDEGAVLDTRNKMLSGESSGVPAKDLAMAATKDANDFTTLTRPELLSKSKKHHLALVILSARAQMAHIIAGHEEPNESKEQERHFNASATHGAIIDHCKTKL